MTDLSVYRQLADLEERLARLETLEAPSFIGARYTTNAGQSVPNATFTVINYEDASYDPLGLVTVGAGWIFTCPVAGRYLVTAAILFDLSAAWTSGELARLDVYKNGATAAVLDLDEAATTASQYRRLGGSDVIECAAGDTLDIRVNQASGASIALIATAEHNHVAIVRLD